MTFKTLSVEIDDDVQEGWQGSDADGDILRNRCPPKYPTDYCAVAGQAERECLELLGFQMTLSADTSPMCVEKGTIPNGFIDSRVFAMCGVRNYKPQNKSRQPEELCYRKLFFYLL